MTINNKKILRTYHSFKVFCFKSLKNLAIVTGFFALTVIIISTISFFATFLWLSDHQQKDVNPTAVRFVEKFLDRSKPYRVTINNLSLQFSTQGTISIKSGLELKQNSSEENFLKVDNIHIDIHAKDLFRKFVIPVDIQTTGLV